MPNIQSFSVATLGFDERERAMLRDLLRLSEHRAPAYRVYSQEAGALPHVLLVNADRPEVLAKWRAYRKAHRASYRCADVFLSNAVITGKAKYVAARPVAVSQLFSLLDRAVTEEHGYRPAPAQWRPPFVLSSQEHALFRSAATSAGRSAPRSQGNRTAPAPAQPQTPSEVAVIMEPADSNAATMSARTIQEAVAEARVTPLTQRGGRRVLAAKARILVVDDSLSARLQMKTALEAFATVIDFADSGEQALRLMDRCKYDLVFLDVTLPDASGYEVCRQVRRHAMQRTTPVVMLANDSTPAERATGQSAGCDAYLIKPVRQTVLTEVISDFIKAPRAA